MSSTPAPSGDAAPTTTPTPVRVAVIVMSLLAILLLMNAGLTWFGRTQITDALVEASEISRDEAQRFVVMWMIPYLVLGLMLATAAWFLPRHHGWARWIGLAGTVVLALLTLFSVLASGGVTFASLLLLVLSIAAITSLLSRATAAWVPRLRDSV